MHDRLRALIMSVLGFAVLLGGCASNVEGDEDTPPTEEEVSDESLGTSQDGITACIDRRFTQKVYYSVSTSGDGFRANMSAHCGGTIIGAVTCQRWGADLWSYCTATCRKCTEY